MRAALFDGKRLEVADVPDPTPGPGELLVQVAAAGLCHSDLTLMSRVPDLHPFSLPLVMGHEVAGVVAAHGTGGASVPVGTPVVVHGPWGCGACRACAAGCENHCPHARAAGIFPPGLGAPGGLAGFLVVPDARLVVAHDGVPAAQAAPLADAGATALHAIRRVEHRLTPGAVAVVIGVGGLGHVAVQLLRSLTGARVIAVDTSAAARELAVELGAHEALGADAADVTDTVRTMTGGVGADVVLDFVARRPTLDAGQRTLAVGGHLVLVGVAQDALAVAVTTMPFGATVHTPYWGSRQDLHDVVALARRGELRVVTEEWTLEDVAAAYQALERGDVLGRAVVLPAGEGWT